MIPLSKSKKLVAPTIKASTSISTTAKFSDEKLPFIPFSQRVQEKNVYSCSSMINGFAMHGRARSAIELFEEMVKTNNSVTFLGATVVCSRKASSHSTKWRSYAIQRIAFRSWWTCFGEEENYAYGAQCRCVGGELYSELAVFMLTLPLQRKVS